MKGKSMSSSHSSYKTPSYGNVVDRNLKGMSPQKAQEAIKPTPAEPVNMHKRMAGCK